MEWTSVRKLLTSTDCVTSEYVKGIGNMVNLMVDTRKIEKNFDLFNF